MTIDWTTFALEVVNFLVLVWILKRFLYQPVLEVLARRRAAVAHILDEAQQIETRAAALQAQFENRLAAWDAEKASLRVSLQGELNAERDRQMQALNRTLAEEQDRQQARQVQSERERLGALEAQAMAQAHTFATRLLSRLAGPELEGRLVEVFLADLAQLPADHFASLNGIPLAVESQSRVLITSAFPLAEGQRQHLAEALTLYLGAPSDLCWEQDGRLLAGLRVMVGPWQLHLSLADELADFATAANQGG